MSGLPKKYAKLGFAKGWKAYKASKKSHKSKASPASSKPRGNRMTKWNMFNAVKGGVYVASVAIPGYVAYNQLKGLGQDTKTALMNTGKAYLCLGWNDNKLRLDVATAMYAPLAIVTVADVITQKTGIQARFKRAINGIIG